MIVVDATAVADALTRPDETEALRARMAQEDLYAPHLIDYEVLSVLRGLVLGGDLSPSRAEDALADYGDLPIDRWPAYDTLRRRAFALRGSLSAYDAAYVVLAENLDCPLVTRDERLGRAAASLVQIDVLYNRASQGKQRWLRWRLVARDFTVAEARSMLPAVQEKAREFVALRADITEVAEAMNAGQQSPLGGRADVKGWEARLHELLEWFTAQGWQLKGLAPLLLDFPSELDGEDVLLCWLEGETELAWYHKPAHGFGGRRPLP